MRYAMLIPALLLAACNNAPNWENEQSELANDLNATAPTGDESNAASGTDYVNEAAPAANEANAVSPVENAPGPAPQG
jgi:hypothetical protein